MKTMTGRVVYKRPHHPFRWIDIHRVIGYHGYFDNQLLEELNAFVHPENIDNKDKLDLLSMYSIFKRMTTFIKNATPNEIAFSISGSEAWLRARIALGKDKTTPNARWFALEDDLNDLLGKMTFSSDEWLIWVAKQFLPAWLGQLIDDALSAANALK